MLSAFVCWVEMRFIMLYFAINLFLFSLFDGFVMGLVGLLGGF